MAHPIVEPVLTRPIVMIVRDRFDPALAVRIRATLTSILTATPQISRSTENEVPGSGFRPGTGLPESSKPDLN